MGCKNVTRLEFQLDSGVLDSELDHSPGSRESTQPVEPPWSNVHRGIGLTLRDIPWGDRQWHYVVCSRRSYRGLSGIRL